MAGSVSSRFFAFLLIAGGVALLSVARADYEEDAPAPAPEGETYLVRCATKLTEECGDRILNNIFLKQDELTPECCKKLVSIGIECHEAMVKYMITVPALSKNASITVPRSKQVWNQCVLLAKGAPAPA